MIEREEEENRIPEKTKLELAKTISLLREAYDHLNILGKKGEPKMENFPSEIDFPLGDPEPKARGKVEVSKGAKDQLLLSIILKACEKRKWKLEWLDINFAAQTIDIDHPSITKEQVVDFFHEVFALAGAELEE